jgi:predicted RNase H-like HicB family nuclease
MIKEFNVIIEKDTDGYFVASIPSLKGCHTQAKSLDVLMERIQEAAELCIEFENEESLVSEFVGIQKILVEV